MRKLAHIGIPTKAKPENATYIDRGKLWVGDPSKTKNNIEYIYFESGSKMPAIMKESTHIAYMVENLSSELAGANILVAPFKPFPTITAAFIIEDGIPIELLQAD